MKAFPVPWRIAVAPDCFYMLCRGVAHIAVPAILRVLLGYFSHEIVTVCFGKDACRSNAGICGVSVNHGLEILEAVAAERAEFIAVNEEEIRPGT